MKYLTYATVSFLVCIAVWPVVQIAFSSPERFAPVMLAQTTEKSARDYNALPAADDPKHGGLRWSERHGLIDRSAH